MGDDRIVRLTIQRPIEDPLTELLREKAVVFEGYGVNGSWVKVCGPDHQPPEHRVMFLGVDVDGANVVGFNLGGEYSAIEDVCTHDGWQLTGGTVEGEEIVCPRHGARFSIRTGEALSAPAYEPTAKFPVRVENGEIQVRDDRWD